jgi:hypothetical protein
MEKVETVKVACEKTKGNEDGFYICNKDKVPKGARVLTEKAIAPEKAPAKKAAKK